MTDVKARQLSNANVVDGFSKRFNVLLDRARFPSTNRIMTGARRFNVVPNTFKKWCVNDRIPGQHAMLMTVVEELLDDVAGHYNSKAVVAWLLAGDSVPNPFEDTGNALEMVELYFAIEDLASKKGIDFNKLSRDARNLILRRVHTALKSKNPDKALSPPRLDKETAAMALVMMETAQSLGPRDG